MDRYEYSIKSDRIKKLAERKDYETAAGIADTVNWERVRNVPMLTTVSQVYEKVGRYDEAKDILLMAYEYAPVGKRILYKLTELAVKQKQFDEAEEYLREYTSVAPQDPSRLILRYEISKAKGEPLQRRITILEAYQKRADLEERWSYELASLYKQAGKNEECIKLCDEIILWFGVGPYVDKAMELKQSLAPLTPEQIEHRENKEAYLRRLKEVEEEFEDDSDSEPDQDKKSTEENKSSLSEENVQEHSQSVSAVISEDAEDAYDDEIPDISAALRYAVAGNAQAQAQADEEKARVEAMTMALEAEMEANLAREIETATMSEEFDQEMLKETAASMESVGAVENDHSGDNEKTKIATGDFSSLTRTKEFDFQVNEIKSAMTHRRDDLYDYRQLTPDEAVETAVIAEAETGHDETADAEISEEAARADSEQLIADDTGENTAEKSHTVEEAVIAGLAAAGIMAAGASAQASEELTSGGDAMEGTAAEQPSVEELTEEAEVQAMSEAVTEEDAVEQTSNDGTGEEPSETEALSEESAHEIQTQQVTDEAAAKGSEVQTLSVELKDETLTEPVSGVETTEAAAEQTLSEDTTAEAEGETCNEAATAEAEGETCSEAATAEAEGEVYGEAAAAEAEGETYGEAGKDAEINKGTEDEEAAKVSDSTEISESADHAGERNASENSENAEAAEVTEAAVTARFLMVAAEDENEGLKQSMTFLKKKHAQTGRPVTQAAKISGEKLAMRDMEATLKKLNNRDMIIVTAAAVPDDMLTDCAKLVSQGITEGFVVLLDTEAGINQLKKELPVFAGCEVFPDEISVGAKETEEAAGKEADDSQSGQPETVSGQQSLPDTYSARDDNEPEKDAQAEPAEDQDMKSCEVKTEKSEECVPEKAEPSEESFPEDTKTSESELCMTLKVDKSETCSQAGSEKTGTDSQEEAAAEEEAEAEARSTEETEKTKARSVRETEKSDIFEENLANQDNGSIRGNDQSAESYAQQEEPDQSSEGDDKEMEALLKAVESELARSVAVEEEQAREEIEAEIPEEKPQEESPADRAQSGSGYDGGMTEDEFFDYAEEYAEMLDAQIDDMGGLAIYAEAEEYQQDRIPLTEELAQEMIEKAIMKAERHSLRSLFSNRYNKDGYLILKEEHFKQ